MKKVIVCLLGFLAATMLFAGCEISSGGNSGDPSGSSSGSGSGSIVEPTACEHLDTTDASILNGCEERTLHICKKCGAVASVSISESHDYVRKHLGSKNCLVSARTADVCTRCGKEENVCYDDESRNLAEHADVQVIVYLADFGHADEPCVCESQTVTAKICTKCGETVEIVDVIPAPGHTYNEWEIKVQPTQTQGGLMTRFCTVCNNRHIDETDERAYLELPPLFVLDDNGYVTTEVNPFYAYCQGAGASCSDEGRKDYFSFSDSDGKEHKIYTVVKTPHLVVIDGLTNYITVGSVYNVEDFDFDGKVEVLGGNGALTCKNSGSAGLFKCDECGNSYSVNVRKNHVPYNEESAVIEKYDATCENDGRIVYVCDECGEEAVHRVLKLGHSWALRNMDREGAMWAYDCYCTRCSKTLKSVTDVGPTICEVSATCNEDAYTLYTDIVIDDSGTILVDGDRTLEVKVVKQGTALGHHNKELDMVVRSGEVFDMRLERNSAAFMALGDLTCGTSDAKNPIDGFYKCDRCETNIPVKLYKSHVGMVTPVKRETCVEEGVYMIDKCDECCMKCTFSVPALGHDWVYDIHSFDVENEVIKGTCARYGCNEVTEIKDFNSIKIIEAPTCVNMGMAEIVNGYGRQRIALAKGRHSLRGKEIPEADALNKVFISDSIEGVQYFADAVATCDEDVLNALTEANGSFFCDVCNKLQKVFLKKDHAFNVLAKKEPTCNEEGFSKSDCVVCLAHIETTMPALGHDVVYETNLDKRTVLIYCKREGCEYGKTDSVTITLPAFNDVLYDKYGRVRIDEDVARESGYEVTEVVPGTCACSGVYTFVVDDSTTIRLLESELGNEAKYFIENGLKISFEIEKRASHQVGSELLCWVADGYRYYGRQCTVCGMVAVIKCEPID